VRRSVHVDVKGLDRIVLTVCDAVLRRQMENDLHSLVQRVARGIADIAFVELHPVRDLLHHAVGQVVDPDHTMAVGDESLSQVASDETRDASDKDRSHFIAYPAAWASE